MKKGFTLIELLAVIVILAIILTITVPSITRIISDSTKKAMTNDVVELVDAIKYKMVSDVSFDPTTVDETNVKDILNVNNINIERLTVKVIDREVYVTIAGKNKWDKLTASGTSGYTRIDDAVTTFVRGANVPVLATGMTPIKWNGSAWVDTTANDAAWYNYDTVNKIWANARTADGSMWVWVPRYIYRIPTANWHTSTAGTIDIQFSKGVDDNWNKASIGAIDTGETANASNNKWTNHPAFTFGDVELKGIWVAKFEATAAEGVANTEMGDNVTTKTVKVVPGAASWRYIQRGKMFTVSRNMETNSVYGWGISGKGIDTHLMKNVEWGVVAYLSQSIYGKQSEITINNNSSFYTGGGTTNSYTTNTGQSTTGNIYGIYDINGGAWDSVAAYINNDNSALNKYGSEIIDENIKYKDLYTIGSNDNRDLNYNISINKKGDALYEVSNNSAGSNSWFGDYSTMPFTVYPWLNRGGGYSYGSSAGAFCFNDSEGSLGSYVGFRPILLLEEGL